MVNAKYYVDVKPKGPENWKAWYLKRHGIILWCTLHTKIAPRGATFRGRIERRPSSSHALADPRNSTRHGPGSQANPH
jgi:hypothetical protein